MLNSADLHLSKPQRQKHTHTHVRAWKHSLTFMLINFISKTRGEPFKIRIFTHELQDCTSHVGHEDERGRDADVSFFTFIPKLQAKATLHRQAEAYVFASM